MREVKEIAKKTTKVLTELEKACLPNGVYDGLWTLDKILVRVAGEEYHITTYNLSSGNNIQVRVKVQDGMATFTENGWAELSMRIAVNDEGKPKTNRNEILQEFKRDNIKVERCLLTRKSDGKVLGEIYTV